MGLESDEKVIFDVTNDSDTIIDALEGEAIIEYKYEDEEEYEEVFDETFVKGKVKTDDGKFPSAAAGKVIEKIRVKITPSNYPFYNSRESSFAGKHMEKLKADGKFNLFTSIKRTLAYRKEVSGDLTVQKLQSLVKK